MGRRQTSPRDVHITDQMRAIAQDGLDGFIAEWRQQIADGTDPGEMFTRLWDASLLALTVMGPASTLSILCAAVERLGQEPVQ